MSGYDEFAAAHPALDRITRLMVERIELNDRIGKLEAENALLLGFARSIPLFTNDKGVTDLGTLKRMWFYAHTGLDEPVGDQPWGKLLTRVDGMARLMPCTYCDADVDGGCTSAAGSSDCLLDQLRSADAQRAKLRQALGNPFLAGHSGCEGGPFLKLKYDTNAQALRAHRALAKFLRDPA